MRLAALLAAAFAATAAPVTAQSFYGYSHGQGGYNHGRYAFNGQADRPGDYRCDAYWDAGDRDCGAAWRDQRPTRYGRGYGRGYVYSGAPAVYPGAYGRPDLVYPGGGSAYGHGYDYGAGRDPRRIDWCLGAYRSYDPASGYYRTYDGRLVFCG